MFESQLYRKLSLTATVLSFMTVAGCSNQPGPVANAGSPQTANDAAAPKPAVANAGSPQTANGAAPKPAVANAGSAQTGNDTAPNPAVANAGSAQAANDAAPKPAVASPAGVSPDVTRPLHLVTLPKGTEITATVRQTLATDKNHSGDAFAARIVRSVKIDGRTVLPRGTQVTGSVYQVKKNELKVVLDSVVINGVFCDLSTHSRRPSDREQPNRAGQKQKKDNSILSARTRLTFKLSKATSIPVKA